MKIAGAGICAGIGLLAGESLEHVPYINNSLSYITNCAVNNLDNLGAIFGVFYGFLTSGTEFYEGRNDETLFRIKNSRLGPISLTDLLEVDSETKSYLKKE